jgi:hypothetical protein
MAYRSADGAALRRPATHSWNAGLALRAAIPQTRHPSRSRRATFSCGPYGCPEIDCVRGRLSTAALAFAEWQATQSGVGADRVLCSHGLIDEEEYVRALAASLGMAFESLVGGWREECPLSDDQLLNAARTGVIWINDGNEQVLVAVPRLIDTRQLLNSFPQRSDMGERLRLTTMARLNAFVAHHGAAAIERRAIHDLRMHRPDLAASTLKLWKPGLAIAAAATAMIPVARYAPGGLLMALEAALFFVFLAWTALRFLGLASGSLARGQGAKSTNRELPVYSIVVALYREAASVKHLIAALRALDYPALGSKCTKINTTTWNRTQVAGLAAGDLSGIGHKIHTVAYAQLGAICRSYPSVAAPNAALRLAPDGLRCARRCLRTVWSGRIALGACAADRADSEFHPRLP